MGNGGIVAAPAFSKVAEDALRMLQVPPDNIRGEDDEALIAEPAIKAAPKNPVRDERSET
jgi:cell division protein FtsI (penicillin-binding protein 3)